MKLSEYLEGMETAQTADQLETALQAPYRHRFIGRTWARICKARIAAGERICAAHPDGWFVPRFGPRRVLTVCGETYRVGRGHNSTGVRYVWHDAGSWTMHVLMSNGITRRAAARIWDVWGDDPHRCLAIIAAAKRGEIPDPELDTLIRWNDDMHRSPVRVGPDEHRHRAHRPCECGGRLWDWGCGYSQGFTFLNWRCDSCSAAFTEYVTNSRLNEIRSRAA